MRQALVSLALAACTHGAAAWELQGAEVSRHDDRYRIVLDVRLDAPRDRAFAVFTDFANLPRINDAVEEVRLLPGGDTGVQRLFTRVRVCVGWFCKHLRQVQDTVRSRAPDQLRLDAIVLPEQSDLSFGRAYWTLRACDGTCLHFEAELEPAFWVPPVIGPWVLQRKMRSEAIETARGIERLAADHAAAD